MRRALIAGAVTVTTAGVVGYAGMCATSAADSLERAQDGVTAARQQEDSVDGTLAALRSAEDHVQTADATLSRWPVDVVAAVPVLGRSWRAERAVTRTADEVISAAALLAEQLPAVRSRAGGVELEDLARVRSDLAAPTRRAQSALADLRATPTAWTPPVVGRGVTDAVGALGPAVRTLTQAGTGLGVLSGLLGETGPRSLMVMLQNNAELRGAGGYAASFATGRLEDGTLSLEPLQDVVAAADPPSRARRVPAPAEYTEDYAVLSGDTTIWRSWNMSPHVPDSALVGARVAGALLGQEPDVVVLLDVPALGSLAALGGTGVVLPDGTQVSASELADALLVDAYATAGPELEGQLRRRAELQAAATTVVRRLLASDVPVAETARTLGSLAAGRHLSVWSARPEEEQALVELGVAGSVDAPEGTGDLSHVSVNNIGANKLDIYVDRDVSVEVVLTEDEATVVQRVRFANEAPEGLVPYVAGEDNPGRVTSRVELSLPPGAQDVRATIDGGPWGGTFRPGASRQRLATELQLPRGVASELEVHYTLPLDDGTYRLRVLPQPLARDADLDLTVRSADGQPLVDDAGAELPGGVDVSGPFRRVREVSVSLHRPTRWERLREFWNSPVDLG